MREFRVFNLRFDPAIGFDETVIQQWLTGGRVLLKQENHIIETATGTWIVILMETESLSIQDPYQHVPIVTHTTNKPHINHDESARARQRREKRQQRKKDTEQALARLDERGQLLYKVLTSWRATRATEEGMPTYEFGSNLLLCEIAQKKPTDINTLRALSHFRPRFYKIAGEELLALVRQFEAGEETLWSKNQVHSNTQSHSKTQS